ncbi:TetR/AcrR family transcriptional regulator [Hahella sp. HN01]|uniref:TetR/AcrR family transcriptional regulator n=1 Tax=Hahella sp. HN01 TaxID=2847262 RepID=UPI001C1EB532|nr:TetR/AcrR family transcriptional regulator [Hahella sp. HN01]MBU6951971.1 TetR/AcrR family transcriptional regulator [Hahella sp. HN01]
MARPSKKSERTEEIMQAFRRCVARYGLEGSTLERIAEESGLQRSLVRHYVGNREDLTLQLIEQMAAQYDREWREMLSDLPAMEVAPAFLRMLFEYEDDDRERMQLESALIFAASRDAAISDAMRSWTERFYGDIAEILRRDYPDIDGDALQSVAFGIASLYFNIDSMQPLQMADRYRASALDAARRLVATLE